MSKNKYVKQKPNVRIGTIGHADNGKATLRAAITKMLTLSGDEAVMPFPEDDPMEKISLDNLTGIEVISKNNK